MNSFFELELIEFNPAISLLIEDEIPACVDMSGWDGLRGMSAVLAKAISASEIEELQAIAKNISFGHVRVLRVTERAGSMQKMSQYDFECLQEYGITLFAICDRGGKSQDRSTVIGNQFLQLATLDRTMHCERWQQLAFYKAAILRCGLNFEMPPWLKSQEAMLIADDRTWWGLPVAASTREACLFADYVAENCDNWRVVMEVLKTAQDWIESRKSEFSSFNELFNAFKMSCPLEQWKGALYS